MASSKYVTFEDLVRFHQEVIAPDLDARMDARLAPLVGEIASLRAEMHGGFAELREELADNRRDMLTHFDMVYTRLDRMAVEQDALKGGLRRVEERVTKLEKRSP